ncbi:hypothetical protein JL720_1303 [Aureococcus anophagefferens]|nr:hypothetical protein JL720_1303 [Aureococcus anophagefferens]
MLKILLLCAGAGAFAPPPQLRHHRCAAPRRNKHHRCAPRRAASQNQAANPETKITSDYVATLFDSFAENFEEVLESLDYCAQVRRRRRRAAASRAEPYGACLDAGCGTGLAAHGLRPHVAALYGVDLSRTWPVPERYAHDDARRSGVAAGLGVVEQTRFQPRTESGDPVRGTLHVLRKRKYAI